MNQINLNYEIKWKFHPNFFKNLPSKFQVADMKLCSFSRDKTTKAARWPSVDRFRFDYRGSDVWHTKKLKRKEMCRSSQAWKEEENVAKLPTSSSFPSQRRPTTRQHNRVMSIGRQNWRHRPCGGGGGEEN